jgi:ATP-dependent exoDNAse (exonuclease V) beta subunit
MKKTAVDAEKVFVYNPKFDYQPLSRVSVDGKRMYATPDGKKLPSVTTVLDKTKPEKKKQALNEWRKRVGVENAQKITTEAANRGTRMHTYLEDYIKQGQLRERGSNPFGWASHAMAQTVIEDGLVNVNEIWGVEVPLYFPSLYAGTTDGCGLHLNEESILDYKQTNKPKRQEWIEDYYLQLVAYALAHNEVYGTNIRKGVVLMCVKPPVDDMGNPLARPQYQEFILKPEDFDYWADQWWRRLELYYLQA